MTGLDTNVLLRYLLQDDPKQSPLATRFVDECCTPDNPGRVNVVVLCELVWVLSRGYHYDRQSIAKVLREMLAAPELSIEQDEAVWQTLRLYERGTAGFADYFIGILNHRAEASPTVTFDQKAAKESLFKLLA